MAHWWDWRRYAVAWSSSSTSTSSALAHTQARLVMARLSARAYALARAGRVPYPVAEGRSRGVDPFQASWWLRMMP